MKIKPTKTKKITRPKIDIDRIAHLAMLTPSAALKTKLQSQLAKTIDHIQELEAIDTTEVTGTNQVTNLSNVTRDDVVTPSLTQEDALMNSKKTHNGLFIVDAVLPAE